MRRAKISVLLLILFVIASSCGTPTPGANSPGGVTFNLKIDVNAFSDDRPLRLAIWNEEQLAAMNRNANCAVSYNAETETEEIHCPDGVEYEPVTPEEFTFNVQEIGDRIEVKSENIRVGDTYRLQISGLNNDDCNTTSASVEEIAQSAQITIDDLVWMTTMMACP